MCPNNFKVMGGRAMSIKCVQMEIKISCMLFIAEGKQHGGPEFNFDLGVLLPKTCNVCFLSFNTDEQLASHIPVHNKHFAELPADDPLPPVSGQKPAPCETFVCDECNLQLSTKCELRTHKNLSHSTPYVDKSQNQPMSLQTPSKPRMLSITCDVCNVQFASKCELKMHESLAHTTPSPSSLLTPQASSTPKKSKQMDQSVSKEAGNMETVDSVYICNVCQYQDSDYDQMTEHQVESHIQHKYRCLYPQCTNIYLTVSSCIKHGENIHEINSKGDFKCVKCKIVCGGAYNKKNHVCPKSLSRFFLPEMWICV